MDNNVQRADGQKLTGTVKVWNVEKGFGFVKADDGGEDLFVHQSEVQTDKFRALIPGSKIECVYQNRNGRAVGTAVTGLNGAVVRQLSSKLEAKKAIDLASQDPNLKTGTVKWFNREKGFGFIVPADGGEDMFLHIKEMEGLIPPQPDDVLAYVIQEKNGKPQACNVKNRTNPSRFPPPGSYTPAPYAPYGAPPPPPAGYGAPSSYAPYGTSYGAPAPAAGAAGSKRGSVKWFNKEKGFGFIIPELGGKDVYFKAGDAKKEGEGLGEGSPVSYEEKNAPDGKMWAVNVAILRQKRKAPEPYPRDDYRGYGADSYGYDGQGYMPPHPPSTPHPQSAPPAGPNAYQRQRYY